MLAGIATEMGEVIDIYKKSLAYGKELDLVHIGEELTDVLWYAANRSKEPLNIGEIEEFVSEQNEQIKFIKGYDTTTMIGFLLQGLVMSLDEDVRPEATFALVQCVMKGLGLDFEKCLQNNVDKLLVRFPLEEGFTTERANNRNLEAERIQLEK